MNREIKFRAWAHASKTMFYPDSEDGWELHNGELLALPNTTVMQATGLKDKNGKEIYEGDIVRIGNRYDERVGDLEVRYANDHAGFRYFDPTNDAWRLWGTLGSFQKEKGVEEIIGNIYENPSLIQKV